MNNPIVWGRLEARKYGVELPDLRSETGMVTGKFWAEVAQRRRDREFEMMTRFVPLMLYAMTGMPDTTSFQQRYELLQPYMRSMKASLLGIQRTTLYRKYELGKQLDELKEEKKHYDRLNLMGSEEFTVGAWLDGEY